MICSTSSRLLLLSDTLHIQKTLISVASLQSKALHNPKAEVIWATSPLIFCLSSSLILCALYQKVDYLVLGTWMNFFNKLHLKLSQNHFYSHIAEGLSMSSGRASYPCLMQTPICLRGVCIQNLLYWSPQPCFHERDFHHQNNATLIFE